MTGEKEAPFAGTGENAKIDCFKNKRSIFKGSQVFKT